MATKAGLHAVSIDRSKAIRQAVRITSFVAICRIATLLQGKGGGKKGRYQGKANTLKTRNDIEEFLKEFTALSMNGTA